MDSSCAPCRWPRFLATVVSSPPRFRRTAPDGSDALVDITYQITQPGLPVIIERRRWLASRHLRRVDGPDKSATIFDQSSGELTLLNAANHTYVTLEWASCQADVPRKMPRLLKHTKLLG